MKAYGFSVIDGRMTFSNGRSVGDVYKEVDGYYVLALDLSSGCWSGADLIAMGQVLNEMNREWDQVIEDYFEGRDQDA